MSIDEKLNKLLTIKRALKRSIEDKGITVGNILEDYSNVIKTKLILDNIPPEIYSFIVVHNIDKSVSMSGEYELGSSVVLRDIDQVEILLTLGISNNRGTFSVTLPAPVKNGLYTLTVTDAAGNNTIQNKLVDTIAPAVPTGVLNSEGTLLTGIAESNSVVRVSNALGVLLYETRADALGNYSIEVNPPLTDGNKLYIRAIDSFYNVSDAKEVIGTKETIPAVITSCIVSEDGETVVITFNKNIQISNLNLELIVNEVYKPYTYRLYGNSLILDVDFVIFREDNVKILHLSGINLLSNFSRDVDNNSLVSGTVINYVSDITDLTIENTTYPIIPLPFSLTAQGLLKDIRDNPEKYEISPEEVDDLIALYRSIISEAIESGENILDFYNWEYTFNVDEDTLVLTTYDEYKQTAEGVRQSLSIFVKDPNFYDRVLPEDWSLFRTNYTNVTKGGIRVGGVLMNKAEFLTIVEINGGVILSISPDNDSSILTGDLNCNLRTSTESGSTMHDFNYKIRVIAPNFPTS